MPAMIRGIADNGLTRQRQFAGQPARVDPEVQRRHIQNDEDPDEAKERENTLVHHSGSSPSSHRDLRLVQGCIARTFCDPHPTQPRRRVASATRETANR
jgi:hypothetical protein